MKPKVDEAKNSSGQAVSSPITAQERCSECRAYDVGGGGWKHGIECSQVTAEERAQRWQESYQMLYDRERKTQSRHNAAITRWHEQVTLWQGKFQAVKHENNKLRNKLYQRGGSVNETARLAESYPPETQE